nr:MAG TPA: hypothetical protein [Caudoviricetes sp.]DAZ15926.1 MAG TPA: hypothetical protein [Caudoviricetes sp.]
MVHLTVEGDIVMTYGATGHEGHGTRQTAN